MAENFSLYVTVGLTLALYCLLLATVPKYVAHFKTSYSKPKINVFLPQKKHHFLRRMKIKFFSKTSTRLTVVSHPCMPLLSSCLLPLSRFLSTRKCSSLPSLLTPLQSPESDKPCSDPEDSEGHLVRAASLPALALETTGGSDTVSLQNTRECHYVDM